MTISLELGSSNTKIFDSNNGLVYCEPSVFAIKLRKGKSQVIAYGKSAYDMCNELQADEKLIQPIKNGQIADFESARIMLDCIFNDLIGNKNKRKDVVIILAVPSCSTKSQREQFNDLLHKLGFYSIMLVPQLTATTALLDENINNTYLVVDIGAGKTEIGLCTIKNVVNAISLSLGGELIDLGIYEALKNKYNISVSRREIERIKETVGSLYTTDETTSKIWAQNRDDLTSHFYIVSNKDFNDVLNICYDKIIEAIKVFLNTLDSEYHQTVIDTGIFFTGLSCEIIGFEKYFKNKLNTNIFLLDSPSSATVEGALNYYVNC